MFRRIVKQFVQFIEHIIPKLEKIKNKVKNAYSETYIEADFLDEVKKRRKLNKEHFIKEITELEIIYRLEPFERALKKAKKMFEDAKRNGDLDELYKLKKED